MNNIKLDSILALVLIPAFILSVRISSNDTPYWLFTLIFIGLLVFIIVDVIKIKILLYEKIKNTLVWILALTVIVSSFSSEIIVRHQSSPTYNIHDIIVQQEAAIRYLLDGKNPYKETYFNTPLEDWHYSDTQENPALYHFVMQPMYLISALPFYPLFGRSIGYFDGRMPLVFLFILSLIVAFRIQNTGEKRRSFLLLLAFNPLLIRYTLEGRSDYFMFGFLITGLFFLFKNKFILSAILLAFAFCVKQSVWPLLPFYAFYLWFKDRKAFIKSIPIFIIVCLVIILPFFAWDPKAFLDSTVFYLSGNTLHSYPISGYGFGMLLNEFGIIKDVNKSFPFIIPQILVGLPLLFALILYLKKNNSVKNMIFVYGVFLAVYWYFSRYFNNSHIIYLTLIFTTSYFWPEKEEKS